jgi:hypothetical protein
MTRLENSVAPPSTTNHKTPHNKKNALSLLAVFGRLRNRLMCLLRIALHASHPIQSVSRSRNHHIPAWLSSIERKSAMHGPRDPHFFEETSSVESARLRREFGIAPVQSWMEMVISKMVTDFKLILSECEMIHEKHSAAKAWFGKRNRHHRPFASPSREACDSRCLVAGY